MQSRIYIANTYYQVYIAIIKELNFKKRDDFTKADLMFTDVATDFKDLHQRVEKMDLQPELTTSEGKKVTEYDTLFAASVTVAV